MVSSSEKAWSVYLIECTDGSLYTGISNDVARRYLQHTSGKGARYTRSHPPKALVWAFPVADRSTAAKLEARIRRLPPVVKRQLTPERLMHLLSEVCL